MRRQVLQTSILATKGRTNFQSGTEPFLLTLILVAVYKLRLPRKVLLTIISEEKERQTSTFVQSESLY